MVWWRQEWRGGHRNSVVEAGMAWWRHEWCGGEHEQKSGQIVGYDVL